VSKISAGEWKPPFLIKDQGPIPTLVVDTRKPSPTDARLEQLERYPSPLPQQALISPKLAALHARINLPSSFSIHTLARCLVDPTADSNIHFNNASLSILGSDFLGYLVAEHIICNHPRLPQEVIFAAQKAFIGPQSLANLTKEWGVDAVHAPGGEVDPGLLQFQRKLNTEPTYEGSHFERQRDAKNILLSPEGRLMPRPGRKGRERTSQIDRIMRLDQFGEDPAYIKDLEDNGRPITTLEEASKNFINAIVGGMLLHTGRSMAKTFVSHHILSRKVEYEKLFSYAFPMKDLEFLCRREGFEPPIARLMAESGRKSSHPLYVVGVFSGRDKLGEGMGGSMKEAKIRACVAALKAWYLYSPLEFTVPSETEGNGEDQKWIPNLVDQGEIYR
jgi:dsRNA-specific ribonuclease